MAYLAELIKNIDRYIVKFYKLPVICNQLLLIFLAEDLRASGSSARSRTPLSGIMYLSIIHLYYNFMHLYETPSSLLVALLTFVILSIHLLFMSAICCSLICIPFMYVNSEMIISKKLWSWSVKQKSGIIKWNREIYSVLLNHFNDQTRLAKLQFSSLENILNN